MRVSCERTVLSEQCVRLQTECATAYNCYLATKVTFAFAKAPILVTSKMKRPHTTIFIDVISKLCLQGSTLQTMRWPKVSKSTLPGMPCSKAGRETLKPKGSV